MKMYTTVVLASAALFATGCLLPERKSGLERMQEDAADILEHFTPGPHVKIVDGAMERITFEPAGCSTEKPVCDDGLRLATGYDGVIAFEIPPGTVSSEVVVESSNPDVLEASLYGGYHERKAQVVAIAPGTASLIVRETESGEIIDELELEVRPFGGLFYRLEEPGDGTLVGDGIVLPEGEDVEVFVDVVGEDDELLMAPIEWTVPEGDDVASLTGFENLFDRNYQHTLMGNRPGSAVVRLTTLGGEVLIPVTIEP